MMFDGEDEFFGKQTPSNENNDVVEDEIDNECEAAASVELLKIGTVPFTLFVVVSPLI